MVPLFRLRLSAVTLMPLLSVCSATTVYWNTKAVLLLPEA